jgi:hypothetical protein
MSCAAAGVADSSVISANLEIHARLIAQLCLGPSGAEPKK